MESFTNDDIARAAGRTRISGVDGARAIAMTAVVAEHSGLLSFGWMGVWLFYVISGFVVTGSLLSSRPSASTSLFIRNFYIRRFARILPPYYLLLAVAVGLSLLAHAAVPIRALSSLVFFYNNFALASGWGDLPGFNIGNLWTVSVEMQFYAIYGLAFALLPRRLLTVGLLLLLPICPIARFVWGDALASGGASPLDAAFSIYSCSFVHFDAFAVGCLLAFARLRLTPALGRALLALGVVSLAVFVTTYFLVNLHNGAHGVGAAKNIVSGILFGQHREAFVYIPVIITAGAAICLIESRSRLVRVLDWRPLVLIGEISYGAYLYHAGALGLAHGLIDPLAPIGVNRFVVKFAVFGLALAVTIALAAVSFFCFERPIVRATGRWLRRAKA